MYRLCAHCKSRWLAVAHRCGTCLMDSSSRYSFSSLYKFHLPSRYLRRRHANVLAGPSAVTLRRNSKSAWNSVNGTTSLMYSFLLDLFQTRIVPSTIPKSQSSWVHGIEISSSRKFPGTPPQLSSSADAVRALASDTVSYTHLTLPTKRIV